jgi:hypothetical protein
MMITDERIAAYDIYVEAHAAYTGLTRTQARAELSQAQFEQQLEQLHQRYMDEEFSIGRLADLLNVPAVNLFDILNTLQLPTYR